MKEAEAYLGVNRRTLYRYIEGRQLPAFKNKLTGRIQFEEEALKRLRDEREEWVPVKVTPKKRRAKGRS